MFANLQELQTRWCEVCIIGAGPVGIALALSLAAKGIRTLLVESGGDRPNKHARSLSELASFNAEHHQPSEATVVRALGGTSLRWGGRCVEYDDIDFEGRDHVPDSNWPIAHSDLRPFYEKARNLLTADYSEKDERGNESEFGRSRESWTRTPNTAHANFSAIRDHHSLKVIRKCTATAIRFDKEKACAKAVSVTTKNSSHSIEAPFFVLAGGGRENARLLLELQRETPELFGGTKGALGRFYMGHLTGEIATVTFSSAAEAARFSFRRSATGALIRDRFLPSAEMQHGHKLLNIAMWPDSLRPDEIIRGNGALSLFHLARHVLRRSRDPVFRNTVTIGTSSTGHLRNIASHPFQTVSESSWLLMDKLFSKQRMPQFSFVSPTNTYLLRYHAEHTPLSQSQVRLSDVKDRNGNFRLDVDFLYARADYKSVLKAHLLLRDAMKVSGMGQLAFLKSRDHLEEWIAGQAIDGYHQIGLTRMSASRLTGVVNEKCQTHDLGNVFVAGSCVFPTSGQANPTLPAVAMSLRLAEHLGKLVLGSRRAIVAAHERADRA